MSDFKSSSSFNRLDSSKKRLYSQMAHLNTTYFSNDFTDYINNSKSSNDFKIQKKDLNLENDKKNNHIINQMNDTEKIHLNNWDGGRKPLNYRQYLN